VLEFRILGPLEVRRDGDLVDLGGPRQRALLAVLITRPNESVGADALMQALWGDDAPPTAAKALQVAVSRLRRSLGPAGERLQTAGGGYRLVVEPGELDAARFEELRATSPREALALWRGPALADLRYEPALQPDVRRLEELRGAAIEDRLEAELALGDHARLAGELEALVAEQPLRERLRAQQMLALYRAGRQADALAAFQDARAALDELGLAPGPELRNLEQAILTHDPSLAVPAPPAGIPSAPPTPTFGRDDDVRRILATLQTTRLLTLVGPGGVGKTRLAVEAARAAGGHFVSLAPVSAAARIPAAVCDALGVARGRGESDAEALDRAVGLAPMLLVADNLEHLPGSGTLLAGLLDEASGLTILATSREPLRVQAERLYPVAPLDASPAVALFADRARARDPAFSVTPAVAEICRRVDGLPLAIELAAARLGLLSPDALAERLTDALAVLDRGPRDAPERQRTLRATLDWSLDLLDDEERDAFAALGAFAGGCELDAAEAVTGSRLDVLDSLVAKSLATAVGGRLTLLEPVRQYAAERLATHPDADTIRARHLAHHLALVRRSEHEIWVRGRVCPGFVAVHREQDNLRAAMSWALDGGAALDALALAGELGTYCWNAQLHDEADAWARRALDACGTGAPPLLRGRALLVRCHNRLGAADREALGLAALEIFRALGEDHWAVRTLLIVSNVRGYNGDFTGALAIAEEALETARRVGDDVLVGGALAQMALGTPCAVEALPLVREGAALLRAAGAHHFAGAMLTSVGMAALREDEYALAEEAQAAALDAARADGGDAYTFAMVSGNVGLAALLAGGIEPALAAFGDELATARAHGFRGFDFEGLLGIAGVAAARGEDRRAAILQAAAWRESSTIISEAEAPVYERVVQRCIAPARQRLGEAAWEAAGAEARAMTTAEAVAYALQSALLPG
jgi:predicted ATPase/DNA-binding SARP family transcriptional activator